MLIEVLVAVPFLDSVCCGWMIGSNSFGMLSALDVKRDPPPARFADVRFLSSSTTISYPSELCFVSVRHTINTRLNRFLNCTIEYLSPTPNLHNSSQFLLYLVCSTLVCCRSCFGDDRGECDQEIVLAAGFRLLCYFCNRIPSQHCIAKARLQFQIDMSHNHYNTYHLQDRSNSISCCFPNL